MIIMVGYPGSGKSSFVKSVLLPKSYNHINRDTLTDINKCLSAADIALREGRKVKLSTVNRGHGKTHSSSNSTTNTFNHFNCV
jgi:bifunctional polynucleotide phosphatase/kinase